MNKLVSWIGRWFEWRIVLMRLRNGPCHQKTQRLSEVVKNSRDAAEGKLRTAIIYSNHKHL